MPSILMKQDEQIPNPPQKEEGTKSFVVVKASFKGAGKGPETWDGRFNKLSQNVYGVRVHRQ